MAKWLHGLALIGMMAVVGVAAGGCNSANTPAPAAPGTSQATPATPSVAAPASVGTATTSASVAPPSAPAPPAAVGDPSPAAQKRYKCASLVTDAEMRSASGYAAAALAGDDQSSELAGQTYCQFFTGSAGISIAVSVFTAGPGWDNAFLPLWKLGQITPGAIHLDGIGDGAFYGPTSHAGLALASGHGVSVIFSDMASGKLKGVDLQGQVAKILTLLAGRV